MLKKIFSYDSPYKKRARIFAILWTLLIFIACLLPAKDIPEVNVPFIDKWVHFILFGGFAFLWLCTRPTRKITFLLFILALGIYTGWIVELLQGTLTSLGRSKDMMDVLADGVGGLLGIIAFYLLSMIFSGNKQPN